MDYRRITDNARRMRRAHRDKVSKTALHKLVLLVASICLIYAGYIILWAARLEIPDFSNFEARKVVQSTKIYDRTGTVLLNSVNENIHRSSVPVESISPYIKNATIAIEDWSFYQHHGIRPTSIARAFLANILNTGSTQGGSTITQQVVKNALLTKERTITRKIKEAILAVKLERVLSKDEILGLYLNESPYGGSMYGVEEASQVFFGKSAKDVTLAEAAYLAALPQAPSRYSPYGTHQNELVARKNLVLDKMLEFKMITSDEASRAKAEQVHFMSQEKKGIKAPHFVFYVRSYLEDKYGKDAVESGGLKVITTLDWDIQQRAEEIVAQYAKENEVKYNAHNAGLVVMDPKTGDILSMVGSRDYFETGSSTASGNYNVTLAHRQPGSSFKPIVYAAAFNKGYTPETVLFDLPTQFDTNCGPKVNADDCYKPKNYDGGYRGPMTLREALAQSINIPAIKVLYLVGINNALRLARDMGITNLGDANQYGLTLVLGGGEVSLLELTNVYGTFATEGRHVPPQKVLSVTDAEGTVLETSDPVAEQVLPANTARLISSILSDNNARAPIFGLRSALYFDGKDVAVKTGTTNDYRDTWVVGYTPDVVVGAWVGNNDNSSLERKAAGFVVTPMWHAVMNELLRKYPESHFNEPDPPPSNLKPVLRGVWQGGRTYSIDSISGKLATEYTPKELIIEKPITEVHTILHWLDKNDPRGDGAGNVNDSQYRLWEAPIRAWAQQHGYVDQTATSIPQATDDVHLPEYTPSITVLSPTEGSSFSPDTPVTVSIAVTQSHFPPAELTVMALGRVVASTKSAPWTVTFNPRSISGISSINELNITLFDTVRNRKEITIPVNISTGNQDDTASTTLPSVVPEPQTPSVKP